MTTTSNPLLAPMGQAVNRRRLARDMRRCSKCKTAQLISSFPKRSSGGWESTCKACRNARDRARRAAKAAAGA